jgi:hypothetical protein
MTCFKGRTDAKLIALTTLLLASVYLNVLLARKIALQRQVAKILRSEQELKVGSAVPAVKGRALDGRSFVISYAGESVSTVLYVFTPSCGWCERNIDSIKNLVEQKRNEYKFVGVSLSDDGLGAYCAKHSLNFPVCRGLSVDTIRAYKFGGTPQTIIVSPEARVLKTWVGAYGSDVKVELEHYFGVKLPHIQGESQVSELSQNSRVQKGVP